MEEQKACISPMTPGRMQRAEEPQAERKRGTRREARTSTPSLRDSRPRSCTPQVERRLVELFATLAHEFRTPLTVIDGFSWTLLRHGRELPEEERDEFVRLIQQASQHLKFLITRLLEIAELEAGQVQLEVGPVDIPALAREAIALTQQQIPELRRERFTFCLECRDAGGTPTEDVPLVRGDGRCLRTVLAYLLDNAVRYSPEGVGLT